MKKCEPKQVDIDEWAALFQIPHSPDGRTRKRRSAVYENKTPVERSFDLL